MKKTAFMEWVDGQLAADPHLAQAVGALVAEMKLEQPASRSSSRSTAVARRRAALGRTRPLDPTEI